MSLGKLINTIVENKIGQLNTIMLARITSVSPLAIMPLYNQQHIDDETTARTVINEPINLDNKIYNVGDTVVVAFLQEMSEGGATRHFDISDAVILGQAGKAGQYSGTTRFSKYSKRAEESEKSKITKAENPALTLNEETIPEVPDLKGSDGENSSWSLK